MSGAPVRGQGGRANRCKPKEKVNFIRRGDNLCHGLATSLFYAAREGGLPLLRGTPGLENCVSDIFREVDEEVRREQLQRLWDRYSGLIIAVAVLIVIAVGGWRGYEWWEAKKAAESGAAFEAAIALADEGKRAEAQAAFARIAAEGSSGYRILARFREAAELGRTDAAASVKAYDALASDSSLGRPLQDLAAVRAGLLLVDTAPLADLNARLEPLTAGDRTFRHTARELLALGAWRTGDQAAAKRWFDMITTDADTPAGTRARIDVLIALAGTRDKG
jgi:hypothetical protein